MHTNHAARERDKCKSANKVWGAPNDTIFYRYVFKSTENKTHTSTYTIYIVYMIHAKPKKVKAPSPPLGCA